VLNQCLIALKNKFSFYNIQGNCEAKYLSVSYTYNRTRNKSRQKFYKATLVSSIFPNHKIFEKITSIKKLKKREKNYNITKIKKSFQL